MAALPRTYSKFLRSFSTTSVARMSGEGHGGGWAFWKKAFFFGAIPAVVLANVNAFFLGEGEEERPEFLPYDHLRIRSKKFPWGDGNHSLIHNSHTNALPNGYEE